MTAALEIYSDEQTIQLSSDIPQLCLVNVQTLQVALNGAYVTIPFAVTDPSNVICYTATKGPVNVSATDGIYSSNDKYTTPPYWVAVMRGDPLNYPLNTYICTVWQPGSPSFKMRESMLTITIYEFSLRVPAPSNAGLQLFDTSGVLTYDSSYKLMKIKSFKEFPVPMEAQAGWAYGTTKVIVVTAELDISKTYAAVALHEDSAFSMTKTSSSISSDSSGTYAPPWTYFGPTLITRATGRLIVNPSQASSLPYITLCVSSIVSLMMADVTGY